MYVCLQYSHWGITVSTRENETDYAPIDIVSFPYPVGARGPIDSAKTEAEAMAFCVSKGGVVTGPWFR